MRNFIIILFLQFFLCKKVGNKGSQKKELEEGEECLPWLFVRKMRRRMRKREREIKDFFFFFFY